jgi:hypothetical protein
MGDTVKVIINTVLFKVDTVKVIINIVLMYCVDYDLYCMNH